MSIILFRVLFYQIYPDSTMVCGLRSTDSHAMEEEASSHHEVTSPSVQPTSHAQGSPSFQPAPTVQPQVDVISQLLPTLIAIQKNLQRLASNQTNQALVSVPAAWTVELIPYEPV